jgi:enamine deaminase RidA (YjgF/YER057c/UK114 family)
MAKQIVHTDAAPKAIGTYSQAVRCGNTVYLAGQIGLDPATSPSSINNTSNSSGIHTAT